MFSRRKIDDWKVVYFAQWLIAVGILVRAILPPSTAARGVF